MAKRLDSRKHLLDEGVDGVLVLGVHLGGVAVGDDHAAGHGAMAEECCEAGNSGAFHLEVADVQAVVLEGFHLLVLLRVLNLEADLTALGTIEAAAGDGDAAHHVVLGYLLDELGIGYCHVGRTLERRPAHVLLESFFQLQVADIVASVVVVEETIEADALDGGDEGACGREGLEAATGADAHDGERAVFVVLGARLEVDIGQSVELVHDDVDVVAADACRYDADALALIPTCNGMEFTALDITFHALEMGCYGLHASGVSDEDDLICKVFGA